MNTIIKGIIAAAAISLPAIAFAQSSDVAYCKALADEYQHFLNRDSRFGGAPQSLQSRVSLAECQAGDVRGIPGLEKALVDAKLTLPSRSAVVDKATAGDKSCGPETWSTDKMMYVGMPCQ